MLPNRSTQSLELPASPNSHAILFVDAGLQDVTQLLKRSSSGAEVIQLDPSGNEIEQITHTLKGRSGISSVQIVSHGREGGLELGQSWLDLQSLPSYAAQLKSWGAALTNDADILLYGCNVAQDAAGKGFVDLLAQVTGADVAASDNLTGSAALGGDWKLEYQTGEIESSLAIASDTLNQYQGVLAPVLTISGTTNFTIGSSQPQVINNALTVQDSANPSATLDGATVTINANFNSSQDVLGVQGSLASGLSASYDSSTGVLRISGTSSIANYQAALRQVTYRNTSGSPTAGDRGITFTIGTNIANPNNSHFYEAVSGEVTWAQARDAAATRTYNGLQGYLVTVTSAQEQAFVQGKLSSDSWLGASDEQSEGQWKWVTGPEAETIFWTGQRDDWGDLVSGSGAVSGQYNNWNFIEPNQSGDEDYAQFYVSSGTWNDLPSTSTLEGYVVEYGGLPGETQPQLSGNVTVQLKNNASPALTGTKATLPAGTEDTPYSLQLSDLLAGYTDPEGDTLSVTSISYPNSTLTINGSTYTFTPNANVNGVFNLNYLIEDGKGGSINATQSFTLAPVNDPVTGSPTATLPAGTEDAPYTVSAATLLQGFSDPDIATNGQTLSVTNLTASNGAAAMNGSNFTITPTANYNGAMTLTYDVTDSNGSTLTGQTRSYTVTAVNDAPTLTGTKATLNAGTEDKTYTIKASDLLTGYTDVEGDPLSVTGLTATNGTLVNNNDGTYSFTPSANFIGAIDFSYTVSDGQGGSTPATQSFAIEPGKYQLTWRNLGSGESALWIMDGTEISQANFVQLADGTRLKPDANWRIVSSKFDFNDDGVRDLAWFNSSTTETALWYMQPDQNGVASIVANTSFVSQPGTTTPLRPGSGWQMSVVTDLLGDSRPEFLWENPNTGASAIWELTIGVNGQAALNAATSSLLTQSNGTTPFLNGGNGWRIVSVGDFDGNLNTPDVLWFNERTTETAIWQLNGTRVTTTAYINSDGVKPGAGWRPLLVGNIDAMGNDEIVWQKGTQVAVWEIGANFSLGARSTVLTQALEANEQVQGLVDIDRNGSLDLVVRSKTADTIRGYYLDSNSLQVQSVNPTQFITLEGSSAPFVTADVRWDLVDAMDAIELNQIN